MKIIQLTAENVKRLHAVKITPNGSVVEIAGRNEQGKSSVLDAIWFALGGTGSHPPKPIRDGETSASVKIDLGELSVRRTWTKKKSYLTVENADGSKPKSPQALLDDLVGALAFDPLAFVREKPADQRKTLIGLLGLEEKLDEINERAKTIRAERKAKNDKLEAYRDELKKMEPTPSDTPDTEIDVAALSAKVEEANTHNAANARIREQASRDKNTSDAMGRRISEIGQEIDRLKQKLADEEKNLLLRQQEKEDHDINLSKLLREIETLSDIDPEPLRATIRTATETNRHVANKRRKVAIVSDGNNLKEEIEQCAAKLKEVEQERTTLLTTAKYPVDGLGFDDNGITYNGLPFEQASQAARIRVGIAVGMAMNPKLRVIIVRDGSLLDDDTLSNLYKTMAENDYQLWIERVGKGSETAIVIEDGRIANGEQAIANETEDQTSDTAIALTDL